MPRQIVSTPDAPSSPYFSQATRSGPFVHVSGTVGIDVTTGEFTGATIHEQTRQALVNCRTILAAAGADLDDVVKVGVLLTEPDDFDGMNEEFARCFPSDPPARYVARLGPRIPGVLVSIRMTAFLG